MANANVSASEMQVVNAAAMQQVENASVQSADNGQCVTRTDDEKSVDKVLKTLVKAVNNAFAELDTLQGMRGVAVKAAREAGYDELAKILNSVQCLTGLKRKFDHLCFSKTNGNGETVGEPYYVMVRMVSLAAYNASHKNGYSDYNIQNVIDLLGDNSLKANKFALLGYKHDDADVVATSFAELRHDYTRIEKMWEEQMIDGAPQRLKVFERDAEGKIVYDDNGKPIQKEQSITETYVPVIGNGNKIKRSAFISALSEWLQENAFSVLLAAAK